MNIYQKISHFKCFKTTNDLEFILNCNKLFFTHRTYPRFFQSYLYLKSERKYFYYGIIDDCFVLIKKKKDFGNRVCYLVLPPISLFGSLEAELKLINEFNNVGIKTKLSDEDIELYKLDKKSLTKDKDNIEMVYSPKSYHNFSSRKLHNFRSSFNRINKLCSKTISNKLSDFQIINNSALIKNWSVYKRKHGITSKGDYCHMWFNDTEHSSCYEIYHESKLLISSIIESILPNKIILDTNYLDYTVQIKGLESVKAMHVWMMKTIPEDSFVNSGSGGWDKGLTAHKRLLKPCKELQIYDTVIKSKLSEEDYQSICLG